MTDEKQKIVSVLKDYEKSTNTGDAALAASLYTSDAIMIPAGFATNVGHEAISNFYSYAFAHLQLSLEFEIHMEHIVIGNDIAYATTTSIGTRLIHATGETVPENNRELWIFKKVEGDWKIVRYMFNIPPVTE